MLQLKGHRSVGARASINNAMPIEGVRALVDTCASSRSAAEGRLQGAIRVLVLNQISQHGLERLAEHYLVGGDCGQPTRSSRSPTCTDGDSGQRAMACRRRHQQHPVA